MFDSQSTRRTVLGTGSGIGASAISGCLGSLEDESVAASDPSTQIDQRSGSAHFETLQTETINGRIEVTTDDDLAAKLSTAESGDVFVLESGTHTVTDTIRHDVDNVTILGQGNYKTRIHVENGPALRLIGTDRQNDRRRRWTLAGLALEIGSGDRVLDAKFADGHQFIRVNFEGWNIEQKIFAHECWDWRFTDCRFGPSGNGAEKSAAVYAYSGETDNTNNFFFVNCWWEPILGHALYSESSAENGGRNGRFYCFNCKFHGSPPSTDRTSDQYFIDGMWITLKLNNCHFVHGTRGHVRQRDDIGTTVQIVNCNFRRYQESCLDLDSKENYLANNSFWSNEGGRAMHLGPKAKESTVVGNVTGGADPSIVVESPRTAVTGNVVDFDDFIDDATHAGISGITVRGEDCTLGDNVVRGAGEHGIVFDGATACTAVGNAIRNPASNGIVAGDGDQVVVTGNAISESATAIDAPDGEIGTNLTR